MFTGLLACLVTMPASWIPYLACSLSAIGFASDHINNLLFWPNNYVAWITPLELIVLSPLYLVLLYLSDATLGFAPTKLHYRSTPLQLLCSSASEPSLQTLPGDSSHSTVKTCHHCWILPPSAAMKINNFLFFTCVCLIVNPKTWTPTE